MKRLFVSLLAAGLFAASPALLAQSYGDPDYGDPDYGRQYNDLPADDAGAVDADATGYYDYARVIRVDPVLDDRYAATPGPTRRCYDRQMPGRYESDPYAYDRGGYRDEGYYRDPYRDEARGSRAGSNAAAIIGGIAGAVLGSQVGGGSGTYAATAVGSLLGSMAGREIYEQHQRDRYVRGGNVRVCDPEPVRDDGYGYDGNGGDPGTGGYDVTYEYNGRQYTRRMDYNPGDRIRVRVEVTAD